MYFLDSRSVQREVPRDSGGKSRKTRWLRRSLPRVRLGLDSSICLRRGRQATQRIRYVSKMHIIIKIWVPKYDNIWVCVLQSYLLAGSHRSPLAVKLYLHVVSCLSIATLASSDTWTHMDFCQPMITADNPYAIDLITDIANCACVRKGPWKLLCSSLPRFHVDWPRDSRGWNELHPVYVDHVYFIIWSMQ